MKKIKLKLTALALLALLAAVSVSMTSCGTLIKYALSGGLPDNFDIQAGDNFFVPSEDDGDKNIEAPSGIPETDNTPEITPDGSEGNVVINGSNMAYAASKALRSAVSVRCSFSNGYSAGSGVIYKLWESGSAFVITNFHVVDDPNSNVNNEVSTDISVFLYGKEVGTDGNYIEKYAIPATYVGGSQSYDIAVLRIENSELLLRAIAEGTVAPVSVGSSDAIFPGQNGIAVGAPGSTSIKGISVTSGIISVDSESIIILPENASSSNEGVQLRVIRIEAPVNSGNSGGGFFNEKGELIGIVNAKSAISEIENIGYAIPSSVAVGVADNIIDYCYGKDNTYVWRALLQMTVEVAENKTEYNTESGMIIKREKVSIAEIDSKSIANGKLLKGDIIKSIRVGDDGKTVDVTRTYHVIDAMLYARVDDSVTFVIERNGSEQTVTVQITKDCLNYVA